MPVSRRHAVLSTLALTATAMLPDRPGAENSEPSSSSAPGSLLNLDDYAAAAKSKIAAVNWEYIEGGAAIVGERVVLVIDKARHG